MNFDTSPAFSLPKSTRKTIFQTNDSDSPGPMYDTFGMGIKLKSKSITIGKSNRMNINHGIQNTPAPNIYNPQKAQNNKKVTIPKGQKNINLNNQHTLDPAYYDVNYQSITKTIQNYSMGSKYPSIMDNNLNTPGPADYQINQSNNKSNKQIKIKFGSASRFQNINLTIPGPGDYQLITINNHQSNKKTTFGTSPKKTQTNTNNPGPNQYQKLSLFDDAIKRKLGKSISCKFKKIDDLVDGKLTAKAFGNYNVNDQYKNIALRSSSFTIGKSQRKNNDKFITPGPTDYIADNYQPKNKFNATIALSRRNQKIDNLLNPGPGAYEASRKQSKIYTIPRSKSTNLIQANPGVGRYDVIKNQNKKGIKFQASNRYDFVSQNMAGVGDYEILRKPSQQITIPKSQRFKDKLANKPGPGDYYIPSSIGKFNTYVKQKNQ